MLKDAISDGYAVFRPSKSECESENFLGCLPLILWSFSLSLGVNRPQELTAIVLTFAASVVGRQPFIRRTRAHVSKRSLRAVVLTVVIHAHVDVCKISPRRNSWVFDISCVRVFVHLVPVYTKHQRQHCNKAAMTLAILLWRKKMESLQNGAATSFWNNSIVFNKRDIASVSAVLSQHWRWHLV